VSIETYKFSESLYGRKMCWIGINEEALLRWSRPATGNITTEEEE
jgi:hypothetical protein